MRWKTISIASTHTNTSIALIAGDLFRKHFRRFLNCSWNQTRDFCSDAKYILNPRQLQHMQLHSKHIIISVGWLNTLGQQKIHMVFVSCRRFWPVIYLFVYWPLLLNCRAYQQMQKEKKNKKKQRKNKINDHINAKSFSRKTHKFNHRNFHFKILVNLHVYLNNWTPCYSSSHTNTYNTAIGRWTRKSSK